MGYESTVHLVSVSTFETDRIHYGQNLVSIELSKMDYNFIGLFDKKVDDFYFYGIGGNEKKSYGHDPITDTDYLDTYGDYMTYTDDIQKVLEWLKGKIEQSKKDGKQPYRRITMLYRILKNFRYYDWRNERLVLVHEGH